MQYFDIRNPENFFTIMTHLLKNFLIYFGIGCFVFLISCKTTEKTSLEKDVATSIKIDETDSTFQAIYNQRQEAFEEDMAFGYATERPHLSPEQEATKYSLVPIFYATDRLKKNTKKLHKIYTSKKGNGDLQLGKCIVSVPRIHSMGEIERPMWWKLEFSEDVEKR